MRKLAEIAAILALSAGIGSINTAQAADITIGSPKLYPIDDLNEVTRNDGLPLPSYTGGSLYLLEIPHTLDDPTGDREYLSADIRIQLNDQNVRPVYLIPSLVNDFQQRDADREIGLRLKVKGAEIAPYFNWKVEEKKVFKKIVSFGLGDDEFYWKYYGEQKKISPGTNAFYAVVEVPHDKNIKSVSGTIIANCRIDQFLSRDCITDFACFNFQVSVSN